MDNKESTDVEVNFWKGSTWKVIGEMSLKEFVEGTVETMREDLNSPIKDLVKPVLQMAIPVIIAVMVF